MYHTDEVSVQLRSGAGENEAVGVSDLVEGCGFHLVSRASQKPD